MNKCYSTLERNFSYQTFVNVNLNFGKMLDITAKSSFINKFETVLLRQLQQQREVHRLYFLDIYLHCLHDTFDNFMKYIFPRKLFHSFLPI